MSNLDSSMERCVKNLNSTSSSVSARLQMVTSSFVAISAVTPRQQKGGDSTRARTSFESFYAWNIAITGTGGIEKRYISPSLTPTTIASPTSRKGGDRGTKVLPGTPRALPLLQRPCDHVLRKQIESSTAKTIIPPEIVPLEQGSIPEPPPTQCDQVNSQSEADGLCQPTWFQKEILPLVCRNYLHKRCPQNICLRYHNPSGESFCSRHDVFR